MSTPFSSAARSTPSLSTPLTQNTAPVLKFRCLYSHDLRRKAKRWHDGFLRFHTFNKRVMVYDTPGNFIGDLHWRESEEIQDGDEMELDKGVLIQVGECMEKTQTDLTGLFEKKKTSQGSPQQNDFTPQSSRVSIPRSTAGSQAPLKSLNELLGIKRAPIGRSVTPKSPYEQRHPQPAPPPPQQQQQHEKEALERPAKRQRQLPSEDILHRKNPNQQIRSRPVVIDLEEETPQAAPTKLNPISTSRVDRTDAGHSSRKDSAFPASAPENRPNKQPETAKTSSIKAASFTAGATSKEPVPDAPINALRFASAKPRKKLMYRELLEAAAKKANKGPVAGSQARGQIPDTVAAPSRDDNITVNESNAAEFDPSGSTLFVLDEMIDEQSPNRPASSDSTREIKSSSDQHRSVLHSIPRHPASNSSPSNPTCPPLTKERNTITNPLAAPQSNPVQQNRPPIPAAPARDTALSSHHPVRKLPNTFRKTVSDPTALRSNDGNRAIARPPTLSEQPERREDEKGPWTSEALDFFDWWPPGRPKPC
ncbi:hypothetical protein NFIA_079580 [Paecilomyces variotii No. 5]|uniref:5'-3' DNA helicase ZGRF1-like N-terminal domain-containing protein n=1 Tax=Byssochlamys spectabilis (strain No. 5 / NBRC 109023) TaxID=1356009 RepID=V5FZ64_BYSSN|nr:hypothetical protein NFIA_079580 [Paecilomyces variotii No. 5]